jgi:hypothetical protein
VSRQDPDEAGNGGRQPAHKARRMEKPDYRKMVLLEGIELSTSPLPRECVTPENHRKLADFKGL